MKKPFYLLLLAAILSACMPAGVQVPQSPLLSVLERKSGLIAYIGVDGNVYVTDQGAANVAQITKDDTEKNSDLAYQYPTWSSDGSQLAFLRIDVSGAQPSAKIFVLNVEKETIKSVYSSETEIPFYLQWSPDHANIGFLSSSGSGQNMLMQSVSSAGGGRRVLDIGSPYYWSWAPNGKGMIVHRGEANTTALSFLRLDEDVSEFIWDETPASFQTPAWSPNGASILLTNLSDTGKQQLVLTDSTGAVEKIINTFEMNTAFAWAPDSEHYAYLIGEEKMNSGALGSLHVGRTTDAEEIVIEDKVIAFFWSPNSGKLAYFIPFVLEPNTENNPSSDPLLLLQLNMLDIATGETKELFPFQPSQEFVSLLPYFDQYHQSMTIWSPDGNNLVLSFIGTEGAPGVAVVAASGNLEPRIIADGLYAVWSWR